MPKYWGKQIFTHGRFPEVGQKQKTERKERGKERLNDGNNNDQATHGARKHAWHTQGTRKPPGPKLPRRSKAGTRKEAFQIILIKIYKYLHKHLMREHQHPSEFISGQIHHNLRPWPWAHALNFSHQIPISERPSLHLFIYFMSNRRTSRHS